MYDFVTKEEYIEEVKARMVLLKDFFKSNIEYQDKFIIVTSKIIDDSAYMEFTLDLEDLELYICTVNNDKKISNWCLDHELTQQLHDINRVMTTCKYKFNLFKK